MLLAFSAEEEGGDGDHCSNGNSNVNIPDDSIVVVAEVDLGGSFAGALGGLVGTVEAKSAGFGARANLAVLRSLQAVAVGGDREARAADVADVLVSGDIALLILHLIIATLPILHQLALEARGAGIDVGSAGRAILISASFAETLLLPVSEGADVASNRPIWLLGVDRTVGDQRDRRVADSRVSQYGVGANVAFSLAVASEAVLVVSASQDPSHH